jgi:hypothetical protein
VKIGLITTMDNNIGDDFIREGICRVLKDVFKGHKIEFVSVNKHKPYTIYPTWHPVHLRNIAGHFPVVKYHAKIAIETLFSKMGFSNFDDCDLIVQCGAPVFWPNCSNNEWAKPIWHEVIGRLCGKIPVLNLAAGSCYPWERQPETLESPEDAEYIKSILSYCCLTTVRDRLAQSVCKSVGEDVPLIPCSAFLASRGRVTKLEESGYILINYMAGGGHFAWEQGIDAGQWEITVKQLISALGKRHKLAFLCHDEKEVLLAQEIASGLPVFYPKTLMEYFNCVSHAKFAICNRMHASVGMAGMGVPSVAVCTDTRLLMVAELGLPVHYVKNADAEILEEETETALKSRESEKERLLLLQAKTWDMYLSTIQNALSST